MNSSHLSPPGGVGIPVVEATDDRLVLSIPPDGTSVRAGFIRLKRSVSTTSVYAVGVGRHDWQSSSHAKHDRTTAGVAGQRLGKVYSSEFDLPVTIGQDQKLDEDVTGLIRYQLERMGHRFSDE